MITFMLLLKSSVVLMTPYTVLKYFHNHTDMLHKPNCSLNELTSLYVSTNLLHEFSHLQTFWSYLRTIACFNKTLWYILKISKFWYTWLGYGGKGVLLNLSGTTLFYIALHIIET